jgi:hypothetical protein
VPQSPLSLPASPVASTTSTITGTTTSTKPTPSSSPSGSQTLPFPPTPPTVSQTHNPSNYTVTKIVNQPIVTQSPGLTEADVIALIKEYAPPQSSPVIEQIGGIGGIGVIGSSVVSQSGGSGSVTSIGLTVPTGLSVTNSPITSSGNIGLALTSGYNIPLSASTTNWNNFYNNPSTQINAGTGLSWNGNTLNASGGGTNFFSSTGSNIYPSTTTSSITADHFVASSTTATSTFKGPLFATSSNFYDFYGSTTLNTTISDASSSSAAFFSSGPGFNANYVNTYISSTGYGSIPQAGLYSYDSAGDYVGVDEPYTALVVNGVNFGANIIGDHAGADISSVSGFDNSCSIANGDDNAGIECTGDYTGGIFTADNNSGAGGAGLVVNQNGTGDVADMGPLTVKSTGQVGIGMNYPSASLSIQQNYGAKLPFLSISTTTNNLSATSSVFIITSNDNVGIGTTTPKSTLTVTGSVCVSEGAGATFACGTTPGNIYYDAANTHAYDVAEDYQSSDNSITPGEVVSVNPSNPLHIVKATRGSIILGIISTDPGLELGGADITSANSSSTRPVALSGRVPVQVSMENGPINIGDPLTISSVAGIAMKAADPSQPVIATALEFISQNGSIMAFVRSSITSGIVLGTSTPAEELNRTNDSLASEFQNLLAGTETWLTGRLVAVNGFFGDIFAKNVTSQNVTTQELCVGSTCVTETQLKQILQNAGETAAVDNASSSTSANGDTTSPDLSAGTSTTSSSSGSISGSSTPATILTASSTLTMPSTTPTIPSGSSILPISGASSDLSQSDLGTSSTNGSTTGSTGT